MNSIRMLLIPVAIIVCVPSALADTPQASPPTATPLGSPGSWLNPGDYPATALRYGMTGITSFKMTVDATGKPNRCDIVESSGFDVLDRATCNRLMTNAKFSPPRDPADKPAEGTFTSRVKWVMPAGARPTVSENFASMVLSIDPAGKVMTCKIAVHIPAIAAAREKPCEHEAEMMPPVMGIALRGDYQGASAEIEIRQADAFTPDLLARVLAPTPGYEQRALNVYRFTVNTDGRLGQCKYVEQRGSDQMATDYCGTVVDQKFDPPFSAFDKDGNANGWHIVRMSLKTGK